MKQSDADTILAFIHGRIYTPETELTDGTLLVQGGKILSLGNSSDLDIPASAEQVDCREKIVVPGFIDLHVHGGGGFDFNDAGELTGAARYHALHGTTSLLPTICPQEKDNLKETLSLLAQGYPRVKEGPFPKILGLHLEGPFLNPKCRGAFHSDDLILPGPGEIQEFQNLAAGTIRLMTFAPEIEGGADQIPDMIDAGIIPALGHSAATFEEAQAAFSAGVRHVTHLFNAMQRFHHREPGCAAAALLDPIVTVEVIADGHHLHDATLKMVHRLKGPERMVLVSDAVSLSGKEGGECRLGGEQITVREGCAVNEAGCLSGSLITLSDAVKHLVEKVKIPLPEALRMVTLTPARLLGISEMKGTFQSGSDADILVLSSSLAVEKVFIGGQEIAGRR
jgi:N-acetylglucosamine-6-phosphate deacetylase